MKYLTFDERKKIEKLLKINLSCGEISKALNRSKNLIVVEVRRSGGRDNYTAKKAQNDSEQRKIKKYENLSKKNKSEDTFLKKRIYCYQRLEALEMQIEILVDQIKKLEERLNEETNN